MPASCRLARRRRFASGHVLTNDLGGSGGGGVAEVYGLGLVDGDRLLICTDGLTDLVGDDEIGRTLSEHPVHDDACRALIDLPLEWGGGIT